MQTQKQPSNARVIVGAVIGIVGAFALLGALKAFIISVFIGEMMKGGVIGHYDLDDFGAIASGFSMVSIISLIVGVAALLTCYLLMKGSKQGS